MEGAVQVTRCGGRPNEFCRIVTTANGRANRSPRTTIHLVAFFAAGLGCTASGLIANPAASGSVGNFTCGSA